MFRSFGTAAVLAAHCVVAVTPVSAQTGRVDPALKSPALHVTDVQYRQYPYGRGRYHHGHRGFPVGAGVAAGLAAGAIIGGALSAGAQPAYEGQPSFEGQPAYVEAPPGADQADADDYCASRFRSYDPSSGTYLGNDGDRHPCP